MMATALARQSFLNDKLVNPIMVQMNLSELISLLRSSKRSRCKAVIEMVNCSFSKMPEINPYFFFFYKVTFILMIIVSI